MLIAGGFGGRLAGQFGAFFGGLFLFGFLLQGLLGV